MKLKSGCRVKTVAQLLWKAGSSDPEEQQRMRNRRPKLEGEFLGQEMNGTAHVRHDNGDTAVYQPEELILLG